MKRTILLALTAAWLTPALALPADTAAGEKQGAQAAPSEPLHLQLARAFFPRESWKRFMAQASQDVTQQITETGKGQIELAPGFADRLREQYELLVPYDDMLQYQARLLRSRYTNAELRRLIAFYRTPLGRKSVPFLHDLMASAVQRAQSQAERGLPEALAQLRPLVRRLPSSDQAEPRSGDDPRAGRSEPQPGDDAATGTGAGQEGEAF